MICESCCNCEKLEDNKVKCRTQPCYPEMFEPRKSFACGFYNNPDANTWSGYEDLKEKKIAELEARIAVLETKINV